MILIQLIFSFFPLSRNFMRKFKSNFSKIAVKVIVGDEKKWGKLARTRKFHYETKD